MRPSISAYNNREGYPDYVSANEAMADFDHEVTIDPLEIKIIIDGEGLVKY